MSRDVPRRCAAVNPVARRQGVDVLARRGLDHGVERVPPTLRQPVHDAPGPLPAPPMLMLMLRLGHAVARVHVPLDQVGVAVRVDGACERPSPAAADRRALGRGRAGQDARGAMCLASSQATCV